MRKATCYIVGAGDPYTDRLAPRAGDLLLAADGGLKAFQRLGLRPHAVVGDMDSFRGDLRGVPVLRFPIRKDDTDLALALKLGARMGFQRFKLYGVAGGEREDHFQAALQLMAGASARGCDISLLARRFSVHAVTDGGLLLPTRKGGVVSVFSATDVSRGVTLRGLDYSADGLTMTSGRPLGVSNRALGSRAFIGVKRGTLLVWRLTMNE